MKKNINLKNENFLKKSFFTASLSTNLGVVVLALIFLVYGVFFVANSLIEKNIRKADNAIKSIEDSLTGDQFREVYNFGVKLIDLESQIWGDEFLIQTKNLLKIEEKTFQEIVFSNMKADCSGGVSSYEIELKTPNYETLANQIKVYKETDSIHNLVLKEVNENEEGTEILASLSFDVGDLEKILVNSSEQEDEEDF